MIESTTSTNINYHQSTASDIKDITNTCTTNDPTSLVDLMKNGFNIILPQDQSQDYKR
ncbi:MAG: hypothetical protein WC147_06310 [Syntrophomonas sp.]|nr:hypothetical protein [Clostridiaceae bacterium]